MKNSIDKKEEVALVSIIIPVYNDELFISDCLESVLSQTYKKIEVVVVNDGSVDKSDKICKKYTKKDKRIKYYRTENYGVSHARNYGVSRSSGSYISFVDGDDTIDETMVAKLVSALRRNNVELVRCRERIMQSDKENIFDSFYGLEDIVITNKKELAKHIISLSENITGHCMASLIKRECFIDFNESLYYMEDTDFTLRIIKRADRILLIKPALYNYRYNEKSVTKDIKNILRLIYGIIAVRPVLRMDILDLAGNSSDCGTLCDMSDATLFCMILSKLKHSEYRFLEKKSLHKIFNDSMVKEMIDGAKRYKKLGRFKRIQIFLIERKMYWLFKITILVSKINGE